MGMKEEMNGRDRWLPKRRTLVLLSNAYLSINEITGDASKTLNDIHYCLLRIGCIPKKNTKLPSSNENCLDISIRVFHFSYYPSCINLLFTAQIVAMFFSSA